MKTNYNFYYECRIMEALRTDSARYHICDILDNGGIPTAHDLYDAAVSVLSYYDDYSEYEEYVYSWFHPLVGNLDPLVESYVEWCR